MLSFQLREEFTLRGVMPHYLQDPMSRNYASLVEWLNPEYRRPVDRERKARIACVQYQMRKVASFEEFARQVTYFVEVGAEYKADFVLLPEFVSMQLLSQEPVLSTLEGIRRLAGYEPRFTALMRDLAVRHGITIVAGSHPVVEGTRIYNTAFVCLPSGEVVGQPKLHITPSERTFWGISGGHALRLIDTPKGRIGVLICYDIEFPEAARYLADHGAEILFVPFCTDNPAGVPARALPLLRTGARHPKNQVYVALAGNVGNLPDVGNLDVNYGQAAVLTPLPILRLPRRHRLREADSNEETVLICVMSISTRSTAPRPPAALFAVTPRLDRRADLFRASSRFLLAKQTKPPNGPGDGPLRRAAGSGVGIGGS